VNGTIAAGEPLQQERMSRRWMILAALGGLTLDAAASPSPGATPCAAGQSVERVEKAGPDALVACFATYKSKDRSCWKFDTKGTASLLPEKQWPAPSDKIHAIAGDQLTSVDVDNVKVVAPPKMTVKVSNEWEKPATVEVCEGTACRKVTLRAQKKDRTSLHVVWSVTVLPDKKSLWVGLGISTPGAESLERYDLDNPKAPATKLAVPQCAEIIGLAGGNMLVQTTDCANAGGERMITTPAGRMLTKVGYASSAAPFYKLSGERIVVAHHDGSAVWDMTSGRRLAQLPGEDRDLSAGVVLGDKVVAVEYTGDVYSYDASLKPIKLGSIPRCRKQP
jgi:hypothetical protein